jgi:hypothetical protein
MDQPQAPPLSTTIKCNHCKLDVTFSSPKEKVSCPRCGCGVFNTLHVGNSNYPSIQTPTYNNPNDRAVKKNDGTYLNRNQ